MTESQVINNTKKNTQRIIEDYTQRTHYYESVQKSLRSINRQYVALRLMLIIFAIFILSYIDIRSPFNFINISIVTSILFVFIWTVNKHKKHKHNILINQQLIKLNQLGPLQIQRQWSAIEPLPNTLKIKPSTLDEDLNVYSDASLSQLLFNMSTVFGEQRLVEWLKGKASIGEINSRQQAIAELKDQIDFRQHLSALAALSHKQYQFLLGLKPWMRKEITITPWIIIGGRIATLSMIAVITLITLQILPPIAIFPAVVLNISLLLPTVASSKKIFHELENQETGIQFIAQIIHNITSKQFHSQFLSEQVKQLTPSDHSAYKALLELQTILNHSQLRFHGIPYLFCQIFLLWDIHILGRLIRWKKCYSSASTKWFDAISNIEASSAMANLAYQNPDWCQPTVTDGNDATFEIINAGHPLINPEINIANDIILTPPHRLLVVTGSNMSGKTTYMRTLGLNVKLALAGSVVCADKMTIPQCLLTSSIHVQDSLHEGTSYFMKELLQLKDVIETALGTEDKPALFLLDEILKGTNGPEREIAVLEVLIQLMDTSALGIITTHDINIAKSPLLDAFAQRVYFQEEIHTSDKNISINSITFDYKAKPGIVKNTNALKLLKLIGIERQNNCYVDA